MTTTETAVEAPEWSARRNTLLNSKPYTVGARIRARSLPGPDWSPANAAARAIAPDFRPIGTAEREVRAPMSNMFTSHVDRHGVPHMHFLRGVETVAVAIAPPKWMYFGEDDFAVAGGGLRRRREVFAYDGWPSDEGMEPVNDTARTIAQFYAEHAGDDLPWSAWDEASGAFCSEIQESQRRAAAAETLAFAQAQANQPAPAPGPMMLSGGVARRGV